MDERKQRILQAVIQDYVRSAEPVGSRTLAKNYDLGISSATVRNEMSDLEELGFLEQPHTSAGRIPSAKGYRYYVDSLLQVDGPDSEDAARIKALWQEEKGSISEFFLRATKLIAQLSRSMSLYLAPAHDTSSITYVHVLPIGLSNAVMVVVTDTGALDNEPMQFSRDVPNDELGAVALFFNKAICHRYIKDLTSEALAKLTSLWTGDVALLENIIESFERSIAKRRLFYTVGTTNLLEQPEFSTVDKVHPILSMIEDQRLNQLVAADHADDQITVSIGTENQEDSLQNVSVIKANFSHQDEALGTIAIVGPTRMEYQRILGLLQYMQAFLDSIGPKEKK